MSTTYHCPEPYEHLEIVPGGDVHVCCSGWVRKPVGNIFESKLADIWAGFGMQEVRRTIRDGSFSCCGGCSFLPAPHGPVTVTHALGSVTLAPVVPARIALLTLAYERTCNLSCPSCRTEVFKPDAEHLKQARAISRLLQERGDLAIVDRIVVTGSGDPFASTVYRELLCELPWHRYPLLSVRLFTNLALATRQGWKKLAPALGVIDQVSVSLDAATPATYALNRRGGNFDNVISNLILLAATRNTLNLDLDLPMVERLELTFTVQANNFMEMPEFAYLALRGLRENVDVVYFAKLKNWGAYTPWEYASRAVHVPSHPEHEVFLKVLEHPLLKDPRVVMPNWRSP